MYNWHPRLTTAVGWLQQSPEQHMRPGTAAAGPAATPAPDWLLLPAVRTCCLQDHVLHPGTAAGTTAVAQLPLLLAQTTLHGLGCCTGDVLLCHAADRASVLLLAGGKGVLPKLCCPAGTACLAACHAAERSAGQHITSILAPRVSGVQSCCRGRAGLPAWCPRLYADQTVVTVQLPEG